MRASEEHFAELAFKEESMAFLEFSEPCGIAVTTDMKANKNGNWFFNCKKYVDNQEIPSGETYKGKPSDWQFYPNEFQLAMFQAVGAVKGDRFVADGIEYTKSGVGYPKSWYKIAGDKRCAITKKDGEWAVDGVKQYATPETPKSSEKMPADEFVGRCYKAVLSGVNYDINDEHRATEEQIDHWTSTVMIAMFNVYDVELPSMVAKMPEEEEQAPEDEYSDELPF